MCVCVWNPLCPDSPCKVICWSSQVSHFFDHFKCCFFPLPSSLSFLSISQLRLSAFHFSLISRIVYPPPQTCFPSRFRAAITTKHGAVTVRQVVLFPYMLRLSDSPAHLALAASTRIHSRYMWRFLSVKFKKSFSFLLNFIYHLFQLYSWVFTIFYSCLTQREMGL